MKAKKIFKGRYMEMLTAADVIISQAIQDKQQLITLQAGWSGNHLENLKERIRLAIRRLGVNNREDQLSYTKQLKQTTKDALDRLSQLRTLITINYQSEAQQTLLLETLAYPTHARKASRGDHEALVEWLAIVNQNLSPQLQTEFIAIGMQPTIIQDIRNYAQTMPLLTVDQEVEKSTSINNTAAKVEELNEIYRISIGVAKIAKLVFQENKLRQQQYSYNYILNRMNAKALKPKKKKKTSENEFSEALNNFHKNQENTTTKEKPQKEAQTQTPNMLTALEETLKNLDTFFQDD